MTGSLEMSYCTAAAEVRGSTNYNLRYTLEASLPAGRFIQYGEDGAGGRYFMRSPRVPVTLAYKGITLDGKPKMETYQGGLYVASDGAVGIYWHWDGPTEPVVRVMVPGALVSVGVEVDAERRQARLQREEQERRRVAQEAEEQAELAKRQAQAAESARLAEAERAKAQQHRDARLARLAEVQGRNRIQCVGAQCERVFALAQAYLLAQADMRIQVATPTLIETFNATAEGQIQMRLLRVPTTGDRWEIVLTAHCRDDKGEMELLCIERLILVYSGFMPHMQRQ